MPILWRYLLKDYLKVLLLTAVGFITILLTSRLEEIAHFASFGATFNLVLLYALYQIPYILPIAIPVSCLISAILLMQKLSLSHELTALRSASFSLGTIFTPIIAVSFFISAFNFYVVSELATDAHLEANLLKNELRSINPLLLLTNKHLMRSKGIFFDTLGSSKMGQSASDVVLAIPNKDNGGINLLIAKNLKASSDRFQAEGATLVSSKGKKPKTGFNELLIENVGSAEFSLDDFSHFVQKKVTHLSNDHLNLSLLLIRLKDYLQKSSENKEAKKEANAAYAEILRRISVALSPLTFTLMGLCFGITLGRKSSAKKVFIPILLAAIYLSALFAAKSVERKLPLAAALYLSPHLIIYIFSLISLRRVSQGVA